MALLADKFLESQRAGTAIYHRHSRSVASKELFQQLERIDIVVMVINHRKANLMYHFCHACKFFENENAFFCACKRCGTQIAISEILIPNWRLACLQFNFLESQNTLPVIDVASMNLHCASVYMSTTHVLHICSIGPGPMDDIGSIGVSGTTSGTLVNWIGKPPQLHL